MLRELGHRTCALTSVENASNAAAQAIAVLVRAEVDSPNEITHTRRVERPHHQGGRPPLGAPRKAQVQPPVRIEGPHPAQALT